MQSGGSDVAIAMDGAVPAPNLGPSRATGDGEQPLASGDVTVRGQPMRAELLSGGRLRIAAADGSGVRVAVERRAVWCGGSRSTR